jgi:hypothetical protein
MWTDSKMGTPGSRLRGLVAGVVGPRHREQRLYALRLHRLRRRVVLHRIEHQMHGADLAYRAPAPLLVDARQGGHGLGPPGLDRD